jgi:queuine tRNA-ribosyltransferase
MDPELDSYASQFSRAYIRHLINVDEIAGLTLVSIQNLAFYLDFMRQLREAIRQGTLMNFYQRVCQIYPE